MLNKKIASPYYISNTNTAFLGLYLITMSTYPNKPYVKNLFLLLGLLTLTLSIMPKTIKTQQLTPYTQIPVVVGSGVLAMSMQAQDSSNQQTIIAAGLLLLSLSTINGVRNLALSQ